MRWATAVSSRANACSSTARARAARTDADRSDGDAKDEEFFGRGGAKHRWSACRMNREHGYAELLGFIDRMLDSAGNVVHFEIEKNADVAIDDFSHERRSVADERLQSDLQEAD